MFEGLRTKYNGVTHKLVIYLMWKVLQGKAKIHTSRVSHPGADLGGVRWVRTNPPFFSDLLLLPACLTLSACVPDLFGYSV